jgi:hypothetical protein
VTGAVRNVRRRLRVRVVVVVGATVFVRVCVVVIRRQGHDVAVAQNIQRGVWRVRSRVASRAQCSGASVGRQQQAVPLVVAAHRGRHKERSATQHVRGSFK